MRYTLLLLSAAIILLAACDKQTKNKCLNGGYEEVDYCICPDGYIGSLCELSFADYVAGTYKGDFYQSGAIQKKGKIIIEPHPNGDPHFIQIFVDTNGTKQYATDSKVFSQSQISLEQDFDDGTSIRTQGSRVVTTGQLSLSIYYIAANNSQKTISFSGYWEK